MTRASRSFAHWRPLPLDFEVCYRAVCSRDARFDGQFFTAVTSTSIYCRPSCPAPTPKAVHVRFYGSAAAAAADGFRACRRCRPEASPGSPEWNIRADLVARALRLEEPDHEALRSAFRHRFLGLALEAFRREEITRAKLEELAAMVGVSKLELTALLEETGLEGTDEVDVSLPDDG